jgi:UDP:flavonoid glycosyltransferase YjiC (YdhE family)
MYGVPQLLFPTHYEQYLLARRLEMLGAAAWIGPAGNAAIVHAALANLLGNPAFSVAARAFAQRYPAYSPKEQRRRVVARVEQIIMTTPTSWGPPSAPPILTPYSTGHNP